MSSNEPTRVRLLTPAGWFVGDYRVTTGSTLLDSLNRSSGFLRLSKVRVEGHPEILPFAVVQRPWVRLVIPLGDAATAVSRRPRSEAHDVAGVLDVANFRGTIHVADAQRISDYFAAAPAFVPVTDCKIWLSRPGEEPTPHPLVHVHVPSLVAVSDTLSED